MKGIPLFRGARLIWDSAPGWTLVRATLLVTGSALPLLTLYITKLLVDAVSRTTLAVDGVLAFREVILLVGAAALVAISMAAVTAVASFVEEAQSLAMTDHVHDLLHLQSAKLDLEYYENTSYFDTLHRVQQDAPFRPMRLLTSSAQFMRGAVSLIGAMGLLFAFHWFIALALLIAATPAAFIRVRFANELHRWYRRQTVPERESRYYSALLTGASHAKELRLFSLGPIFMERFRSLRSGIRGHRLKIVRRRASRDGVAQAIAVVAMHAAYGYVAVLAMQGTISVGDMVMYFGLFQRGHGAFREVLTGLASLYEDTLFLRELCEFMDLAPQMEQPRNPRPLPTRIRNGVVFRNVSFRYPGSKRVALSNVNLAIRPGEHVALVGANGSGKSTFVKLLCRLYDPTDGSITIDGVDLKALSTTDLQSRLAVVFQDYSQYHLSARENIWLGDVSLPLAAEQIERAASLTGAHEFIGRLTSGYDTILGKQIRSGEQLSIGEWQKVALARAFLRDGAIIVLDEPTSALDAQSERVVFSRFRELARERTAVVISHRMSSVRSVDCIYVLESGRIIERGGHDDLLRLGGVYARLFEAQAEKYR